jgi:hypothetical protein
MSKINDTSTLGPATQVRELRDDELENVSGGAIIAGDFAYLEIAQLVSRARFSGIATSEVFELNS